MRSCRPCRAQSVIRKSCPKPNRRWVNRGAKGIALLDDTGPRTRLRYVFDIADTHLVRGGKTPLLWNLDSHEHEQAILDHLEDTYGLSQTDSMNTALMELAQQLTADNLDEAMDGLACCIVRGEMRNTLIMAGVIAAVVLFFTAAGSVYALISSIKRRIRRMTT